jgi:hypothetical protein
VVRLHAGLSALYRKKIENLTAALNEPGTAAQAGEIIRDLIDRIVLTPSDGQLKAEVFGDLETIANFAEARERITKNAGPQGGPALLSVVAGACNQFYLLFVVQGLRPTPAPVSGGMAR